MTIEIHKQKIEAVLERLMRTQQGKPQPFVSRLRQALRKHRAYLTQIPVN